MEFKKIKKRYIVLAVLAAVTLYSCSGSDDDEQERYEQANNYAEQQYAQRQQEYAQQQQVQMPTQVAPAPQGPVIINQQPASGGDHGFLSGLMMGHLFSGGNTREVHHYNDTPRRYDTRRTTVNRTVVNNTYNSTSVVKPAPIQPNNLRAQKPANWNQPSVTARSYNVAPPPPSSMTKRTWSTSSSKGWGSSSSYRSKSTSFRSSGRRR